MTPSEAREASGRRELNVNIDNLVIREINSAEFPAAWKIVVLRRPIGQIFRNDPISYLGLNWVIYDIRGGAKQLVLRPV